LRPQRSLKPDRICHSNDPRVAKWCSLHRKFPRLRFAPNLFLFPQLPPQAHFRGHRKPANGPMAIKFGRTDDRFGPLVSARKRAQSITICALLSSFPLSFICLFATVCRRGVGHIGRACPRASSWGLLPKPADRPVWGSGSKLSWGSFWAAGARRVFFGQRSRPQPALCSLYCATGGDWAAVGI